MDSVIRIDPKHSLNSAGGLSEGGSLQVKGASSETDSSGRNPYFALQGQPEEQAEEKNALAGLQDTVSFSRLGEPALFPNPKQVFSRSPESLHKFSGDLLAAFIPFRIPISLQ